MCRRPQSSTKKVRKLPKPLYDAKKVMAQLHEEDPIVNCYEEYEERHGYSEKALKRHGPAFEGTKKRLEKIVAIHIVHYKYDGGGSVVAVKDADQVIFKLFSVLFLDEEAFLLWGWFALGLARPTMFRQFIRRPYTFLFWKWE
jgi:hypothetical protein